MKYLRMLHTETHYSIAVEDNCSEENHLKTKLPHKNYKKRKITPQTRLLGEKFSRAKS